MNNDDLRRCSQETARAHQALRDTDPLDLLADLPPEVLATRAALVRAYDAAEAAFAEVTNHEPGADRLLDLLYAAQLALDGFDRRHFGRHLLGRDLALFPGQTAAGLGQ